MDPTHKRAQLYQRVWLEAMEKGEVKLTLTDHASATRFRFAMYKAVNSVRTGKTPNKAVLDAVTNCTLKVQGNTLLVTRLDAEGEFASVLAQLGLTQEGLKPVDHAEHEESAASLDRLRALLDEGTPKAPDTPDTPSASGPAGKRNPYY